MSQQKQDFMVDEQKQDRYQYQPWYIKLWRSRWWLLAPWWTIRMYITERLSPYTDDFSLPDGEYSCQDCDWCGSENELDEVQDLEARVDTGEPVPAGQCPMCGALCHQEENWVLSLRFCWSIAAGLVCCKMNWLYDWDEVITGD